MAITSKQIVDAVKDLTDINNDLHLEGIPDVPSFFWKLTHLDPAVYRGIVVSVVGLLATFGLILSDQNSGAIVAVVSAIAALVQAIWTRGAVTPNQKVVVYKPNPVGEPTVVVAGQAVSSDVVAVANAAATKSDVLGPIPFPVTGSWEH